jgi:hypothetical protein
VTRFGEISPIGRLFILGNLLKMTEVAQIFELRIFHLKNSELSLKKWVGRHSGRFFINLSAHPGLLSPL